MSGAGLGLFLVFWAGLMIVGLGGFVLGVIALIDVARSPLELFGPWWDNTRQAWIIGLAVSFALPVGPLIAGILWFTTGKRGIRDHRVAGRPFWGGAPKPPPMQMPPPGGWAPPPPSA